MLLTTVTTNELMQRSRPFRYFFWGSVIFSFFAMVLVMIYLFTESLCTDSRSCANASVPSYLCYDSGVPYCCAVTVEVCDSLYCQRQWTDYCLGLLISAGVMMSVGVLLAFLALLLFCNFRHRVRMGEYAHLATQRRHAAERQSVQTEPPTLREERIEEGERRMQEE